MQAKLRSFAIALATVVTSLYHYTAPEMKGANYGLWIEEAGNTLFADNVHGENSMSVSFHYFTKTEFDSVIDSIEAKFENLGLYYELISVQYEDATGYIHYDWSVLVG